MPTSKAGTLAGRGAPIRPTEDRPCLGAAGFTLIELTIVLVVLGISAGLVLPALSGLLSREGEKTASRVILGTLRRAQAEALLGGHEWRVDLDWSKSQCRARQVEQAPPPAASSRAASAARQAAAKTGADSQALGAPGKAGQSMVVTTALPGKTRPRLVLTESAVLSTPDLTSIVLRPEGLCQPAFIRLPGNAGQESAIVISAVGCRVELLQTDLDKAQERFEKTHGQPRTAWADVMPGPGS